MNELALLLFPLIFLGILLFASTTIFENPTLANAVGNVTIESEDVVDLPDFPVWNSTYENSVHVLWEADLNFFDANTTSNWQATIPNGWLLYAGDWMASVGQWFIDIGEVIFYSGVIAFEIITPPDQFDDVLNTIFIVPYAVVYLMLALGLGMQVRKWIGALMP